MQGTIRTKIIVSANFFDYFCLQLYIFQYFCEGLYAYVRIMRA